MTALLELMIAGGAPDLFGRAQAHLDLPLDMPLCSMGLAYSVDKKMWATLEIKFSEWS